jgi:hypothetical protein
MITLTWDASLKSNNCKLGGGSDSGGWGGVLAVGKFEAV